MDFKTTIPGVMVYISLSPFLESWDIYISIHITKFFYITQILFFYNMEIRIIYK